MASATGNRKRGTVVWIWSTKNMSDCRRDYHQNYERRYSRPVHFQ